ncbi:50S ribosomal protein L10 [Candidatus Woesearchaeota archaeon]|nr:50S ribosomal protein L10 [Candidatus Woesearchaeota archaeon]
MPGTYETKSSPVKRETVASYIKLIKEYPIVGAVDVEHMPALQLNRLRAQLRGTVLIKMAKRRILSLALESSGKEGVKELIPYLKGMPALIFTEESPFKLYKTLQRNKSNAPIKPGQAAPNNIVVPAGPTGFAPGPVIGELGSLGIKAGIEGGKVAIKADAVVAKAGDVVSAKLASILGRLGIEPMEIGLNLTAVCEKGEILVKEVLDIDEEEYQKDFNAAASWAFNLAFNAGFPTADTVRPLLQAAHRDAYLLAAAQDVMTDETKERVLAKAEAQAAALKQMTGS